MQNQSNADVRFHVQLDQSGFVTAEIGKESFGLSSLRRYSEFYNYLYKRCLVLCQEKVQIKYNQFSLFM